MKFHRWTILLASAAIALAACGENDETDVEQPDDVIFETDQASEDECPDGGTIVRVGTDSDGDGTLDDDAETFVVCDGEKGDKGDKGDDGDRGDDAPCATVDPVSIDATLEEVDHYRTDNDYQLTIDTDTAPDDLHLVVDDSVSIADLDDTDDGVTTTLNFETSGVTSILLVASNGCTVDVQRLHLLAPVYPPSYEQLVAGAMHNCGLRVDGSVDCWGEAPVELPDLGVVFGQLDVPDADDFVELSSSIFGICGIHDDETASCWGNSVIGESLGALDSPSGQFAQVAPGFKWSCGATNDDTGYCWSTAEDAELEFDADTLVDNGTDADVAEVHPAPVAAGPDTVVALLDNGEVYGVEINDYDDDGDTVYEFDADELLEDHHLTELDTGSFSVCGLTDDSDAICSFVEGEIETDGPPVEAIDAGFGHACLLDEDGDVDCIGPGFEDTEGDLPRNTTELDVPEDTTFEGDVSAGLMHSCGITDEDLVVCWGEVFSTFSAPFTPQPAVTQPIQ